MMCVCKCKYMAIVLLQVVAMVVTLGQGTSHTDAIKQWFVLLL